MSCTLESSDLNVTTLRDRSQFMDRTCCGPLHVKNCIHQHQELELFVLQHAVSELRTRESTSQHSCFLAAGWTWASRSHGHASLDSAFRAEGVGPRCLTVQLQVPKNTFHI